MKHSTEQDRAYYSRIGRAHAALADTRAPASLQEAFDRFSVLEQLHLQMGGQVPLNDPDTEGDLASHLAYLARLRAHRSAQAPALPPASRDTHGDNGT